MNLESILPPLPASIANCSTVEDFHLAYGLRCARAGALAALDELERNRKIRTGPVYAHDIRRLRDTIMEGK